MPLIRKPKLGTYLEWHGSKIRVVVMVPPALQKTVGKTKLRETLPTSDARAAEQLKWPVITRLKKKITVAAEGRKADSIVEQGKLWREAILSYPGTGQPDDYTPRDVLVDFELEKVAAEHGEEKAALLLAIAEGKHSLLQPIIEDMIIDRRYPRRSAEKARHVGRKLTEWCEERGLAPSAQSFDLQQARLFFRETFIVPNVNATTANDFAKMAGRIWRYMFEAGQLPEAASTPWDKQRIPVDTKKLAATGQRKRPFTNEEVATLLDGVTDEPFPDFMRVAALSGMRPAEIARLTVDDVTDGVFNIREGKTAAAIRKVPIHSGLNQIIEKRLAGKTAGSRLFDDLPGTMDDLPFAALSKRFTRRRRKLGIGEKRDNNRQDTADFYSFRRWFIRRACEALEKGALGFTPWTLAQVVAHSVDEDGELPLALTMRRYPGEASEEAKRACVEAVTLPVFDQAEMPAAKELDSVA